jgi:hypothetical protein
MLWLSFDMVRLSRQLTASFLLLQLLMDHSATGRLADCDWEQCKFPNSLLSIILVLNVQMFGC